MLNVKKILEQFACEGLDGDWHAIHRLALQELQHSIRRFHFVRNEDVSGISGTGVVGEGVVFSDGKVAFTWLSKLKSHAFYESLEVFEAIHGHEGRGRVEWIDV